MKAILKKTKQKLIFSRDGFPKNTVVQKRKAVDVERKDSYPARPQESCSLRIRLAFFSLNYKTY